MASRRRSTSRRLDTCTLEARVLVSRACLTAAGAAGGIDITQANLQEPDGVPPVLNSSHLDDPDAVDPFEALQFEDDDDMMLLPEPEVPAQGVGQVGQLCGQVDCAELRAKPTGVAGEGHVGPPAAGAATSSTGSSAMTRWSGSSAGEAQPLDQQGGSPSGRNAAKLGAVGRRRLSCSCSTSLWVRAFGAAAYYCPRCRACEAHECRARSLLPPKQSSKS